MVVTCALHNHHRPGAGLYHCVVHIAQQRPIQTHGVPGGLLADVLPELPQAVIVKVIPEGIFRRHQHRPIGGTDAIATVLLIEVGAFFRHGNDSRSIFQRYCHRCRLCPGGRSRFRFRYALGAAGALRILLRCAGCTAGEEQRRCESQGRCPDQSLSFHGKIPSCPDFYAPADPFRQTSCSLSQAR